MSKYIYVVKLKDKIVFKSTNAYECALEACNAKDWKNTKMETNNPSCDEFIHMKYNPKLESEVD